MYNTVKTTVNATDGSLEPVINPEPLYLLNYYTKISIKQIWESFISSVSMENIVISRT